MLRDDRGVATVWTAVATTALVATAGLLFSLGSVIVTRHQAAAAADLAALAAAGRAEQGDLACQAAEAVSRRMGVRLVVCRFEEWDALVEVEADVPGAWGSLSARARAGPVAR
ncbi:Rv3654c family TadE-like protein [Amycolatopsis sacchari]|uniref:Rv3654c family TadE-like protein n=1 Tax=Amycolatopsis sacchari TaxID=115433 RepID=UPI003D739491